MAPSAYWGDEKIWDTRVNNHNSMFDGKGRLWLSATVRAPKDPDFCGKGSEHPSAKAFPLTRSMRQIAMLDPKTMKYTFVDTCFGTHHLQFGYDRTHAVDERRRTGGRLDQHQIARRDRRHRQGTGMDRARPG